MSDALEPLRRDLEEFGAACREDPLYQALVPLLSQRPAALAWLASAEPTQRRPNLILAAIHERVLAGAGGALTDYYPSAGGGRAPDADLPRALDALLEAEAGPLAALVATRRTQTNEIGRCAVLAPALAAVSRDCGERPLALLDFGCSAGLNLGVDRYACDYGAVRLGAHPGPGTPRLACHAVAGAVPPPGALPVIACRAGVDVAPVDLRDPAERRWLQACLWPHDRVRRERFDQAAAIVAAADWPLHEASDGWRAVERWAAALSPGVQPVVFNSWVLAYFTPRERDEHVAALRELVRGRGLAWICAEEELRLGDPGAPPEPDDRVGAAELERATLWWATWRGEDGAPRTRLLAHSHPHGRWVAWRG